MSENTNDLRTTLILSLERVSRGFPDAAQEFVDALLTATVPGAVPDDAGPLPLADDPLPVKPKAKK